MRFHQCQHPIGKQSVLQDACNLHREAQRLRVLWVDVEIAFQKRPFLFPSAGQDDRSPPATSGCLGCKDRVSDFRAETSPTAGTSTIRQISVQPDQRASCYRTSDRRFSAPLPDQTAGLWRLIRRHKASQRSAEWHLPAGGTPVHVRCRCAQAALTDAGWE